jgi:hypothetical protein
MLSQLDKECEVELEVAGKLQKQLMNTVEPLKEYRTSLICVGATQTLAAPVCHFMAKVKPLFFDQNLEALKCPVIGVKQQLGERHKLRSSIPAIAAVHYHRTALSL